MIEHELTFETSHVSTTKTLLLILRKSYFLTKFYNISQHSPALLTRSLQFWLDFSSIVHLFDQVFELLQPIMEMRCDVLVFILFCPKNGRKKTFDQHLFKTSGDQRKALHRLWAASQFLEVFAVLRSCLLESRNWYQGASLRIKFIQKYFISFPSPSFFLRSGFVFFVGGYILVAC